MEFGRNFRDEGKNERMLIFLKETGLNLRILWVLFLSVFSLK